MAEKQTFPVHRPTTNKDKCGQFKATHKFVDIVHFGSSKQKSLWHWDSAAVHCRQARQFTCSSPIKPKKVEMNRTFNKLTM